LQNIIKIPDRILIIQTASIGDVILATALVESVHNKYLATRIDLLVRKGHETLFSGHPYLHSILTWNKKQGKYVNLARLLTTIRRNRYDVVINIQRFLSSGLITVLAGATSTTGFSKNPLSLLFSKRVPHPIGGGLHETARNHTLLAGLVDDPPARPALYPSKDDIALVRKYELQPFYTISPASLWFTKQLPADRWVEFIGLIPADATIILLGSGTDRALCEQIIRDSQRQGIVNLAGRLTFLQSAALMKMARMNYTNDSAPMHLASAVNAPVTAVFCSTLPAFGFGPLSDDSAIAEVNGQLSCRPCGLHGHRACPEGHFRCAYEISLQQLTSRL